MNPLTQKESRELKKNYVEKLQTLLENEGIICDRIVKGLAVLDESTGHYILFDAVVKNEDFDIEDAIMEWEERQDKEAERAEKRLEKEAKVQAKKDKVKE